MPLTPQEAAAALQDIASTQRRSQTLSGYRHAAPHLIIWGIAWFFGYSGSAFTAPDVANGIWLAVVVLGSAASAVVGRRRGTAQGATRASAAYIAMLVFTAAIFAVFSPVSQRQAAAFFPLLVGLSYTVMGIWGGVRLVVAGVLLSGLTLFGFFALGDWFAAWMAVIGSGALILMGLWLRRV